MSIPLDILVLDDNPSDAELIIYELQKAGFDLNWKLIDNEVDYLANLTPDIDIILSDYAMPSWDGPRALKVLQKHGFDIPFIIISGTVGEDLAVECIKQGAADYILKDRMGRLGQAVSRALSDKRQHLEKHRIEHELQQLKEFNQNIVQSIAEGIVILDPALLITFANPAAIEILGYSLEELIGLNVYESNLLSQTNQTILTQRMTSPREGKQRYEIGVVSKNNICCTLLLNVISQFEEGRFAGLLISFTDITERKKTENELRKLYSAIEQSNSSVVMTNLDGNIEYVNHRFTQLTGYTAEEVLGKNPRVLQSGYTSQEVYKQLWYTILAGGKWRGEFLNKKKNGELFWELASISGVKDSTGNLTSFLAVKENITERKRIEEALADSEERLSRANSELEMRVRIRTSELEEEITRRELLEEELRKSLEKEQELGKLRSRFISMTSHEFRTPLSIILSDSEMLEYYSEHWTEEKRRDTLHGIQEAVQRLTFMLDDILTVGKAESGMLEFKPTSLNLTNICEGVLTEITHSQPVMPALHFVNKFEPEIVMVDEKLIRHILINLLSNAIKYSKEGSPIYLSLCSRDNYIIIEVKDLGMGIPKEDQQHIFEAFHRASNVENISGTGLGLAIVKKSVEVHGGDISFSSEFGMGTIFTITLPLKPSVTS